jgi:TolB-like protein
VLELSPNNVDPELARTITEVVTTQLSKIDGYRVISHNDILAILTHEQQKQLIGCGAKEECLYELSGALNADLIVAGLLGRVEDRYVISLKLIDSAAKDVKRRSERTIPIKEAILIEAAKNVAYHVLTGKERATRGIVRMRVTEPEAGIAVDGKAVGSSPMDDWITLEAGTHTFTVQKEGFVAWNSRVELKPEQQIELNAELVPLVEVGVEQYSLDTWAWVTLGVGAALGAGGIAAGVSAKNQHDDYVGATSADNSRDLKSKTRSSALIANVLFFSAIGAAAATATLFITDTILERSAAPERSQESAGAFIAPTADGAVAGAVVHW